MNLEERLERIERAVKEHLTNRLSPTPQDAKGLGTRDSEGGLAKPPNPNPPKLKQRALYLWKVSNEDSYPKGVDGGLLEDYRGKLKFIGTLSEYRHVRHWLISTR